MSMNNNINESQDTNINLFDNLNVSDENKNKEKHIPNVKLNNKKNLRLSNLDNNEELSNEEKEEISRKKMEEEKERNDIRNKLRCFICFGKVVNAVMCPFCKKLACEQCLKKIVEKTNFCSNCKSILIISEIIKLPMLDNFTNFFINNIEQKNENEDEKDEEISELRKQKCQEHPNKNIEYICMNCDEYLCTESLLVFNKESVNKHKSHIILSFDDIENFKLYKIIKEYRNLSENKNKISSKANELKKTIKDIDQRKKSTTYIFDTLKEEIKSKYEKRMSVIKSTLESLKYKKKDINKMIQNPPNLMIELNDQEKSKKILKELKSLNNVWIGEKDLEKETNFQKEIKLIQYESQPFEIKLPNNGQYIEEYNILKTELNFIPNIKCTLNCQLLLNNYHLTLSMKINKKTKSNHSEKFIGYLYLENNLSTKSLFLQGSLSKDELIFFTEYDFNKFKEIVGEDNKCYGKINITKYFYK